VTDEQHRDWRGTPIEPGGLVIYGAPVGRSIAMVEATVAEPMLTPSGRIWLDVVRRAYGGYSDEVKRVHVGADRLTVVDALPATARLTEQEKRDRADEQRQRRTAHIDAFHIENTHAGISEEDRARCSACWKERRRFDEAWEAGEIHG
jgi:hypothetical protein